MSTITQADLAARVLRYLKVLEGSEVASAEDDAVINEHIEQVHAELQEKGLAYWDLTAIPIAVLPGLIRMVGADSASDFVGMSEVGMYESKRLAAERMIRAVIARPDDHTPIPHNYF